MKKMYKEDSIKLAGLTWWRNNYGSILQAYALQCILNGYKNIDYEILCQYGKRVSSLENLLDKLRIIGVKRTSKRIFWKFVFPRLRSRTQNLQKFVDKNLKISVESYTKDEFEKANDKYEGFVCGSDQIWNPILSPVTSIYWMRFAEKSKFKFSYAPSLGVNNLTEEQKKIIKENLQSFQFVSCREEIGSKILNETLGNEKCVTVLDPTLLINREKWDVLSSKCQYKSPYILAYMLRGNKKERKLIERFAKEVSLPIITIPFLESENIELYDFKFGDVKLWDAAPNEFIAVIRYAEYVFTDSYHAMLFSCMYHKTFFTFPKKGKGQMNRIFHFQNMLQMPSRMINENTTVESIRNMEKIDWNMVDKIIEDRKKFSQRYLDDALKQFKSSEI